MTMPHDPVDNQPDDSAPDSADTAAAPPEKNPDHGSVAYPLTRSQRDALAAARRVVMSPGLQKSIQTAQQSIVSPNVTRALSEVTRKFAMPPSTIAALNPGRNLVVPASTIRSLDLARDFKIPSPTVQGLDVARNVGLSVSTVGALSQMGKTVPSSSLVETVQTMNSMKLLTADVMQSVQAPIRALADVQATLSRTLPSTLAAATGFTRHLNGVLADIVPVNRMVFAQLHPAFEATRIFDGLRDSISALMANWTFFDGLGDRVATLALAAARRVKRAILGDPEHRRIVAEFARRWLGIKRVDPVTIDAVIDALLDGTWEREDAPNVLRHLNKRTRHHRAGWRLTTERQLRGQSVTSLHKPLTADGATLLDFRPDVDTIAPAREEYIDPRLTELFSDFTAAEVAVIETRLDPPYEGPARTWEDAAVMCGLRPKDGELIRRRYNRRRERLTA